MALDFPCLSMLRPRRILDKSGLGEAVVVYAKECSGVPRPEWEGGVRRGDSFFFRGRALVGLYVTPLPHGGHDYWIISSWRFGEGHPSPPCHITAFEHEPLGWRIVWLRGGCACNAIWRERSGMRVFYTFIHKRAMIPLWDRYGAPYEDGRWLAGALAPPVTHPGAMRVVTPTHYQHWTNLK